MHWNLNNMNQNITCYVSTHTTVKSEAWHDHKTYICITLHVSITFRNKEIISKKSIFWKLRLMAINDQLIPKLNDLHFEKHTR